MLLVRIPPELAALRPFPTNPGWLYRFAIPSTAVYVSLGYCIVNDIRLCFIVPAVIWYRHHEESMRASKQSETVCGVSLDTTRTSIDKTMPHGHGRV